MIMFLNKLVNLFLFFRQSILMLLNKIICKRIKCTYIINKILNPLFKIEEDKLEIRSFTMLYEKLKYIFSQYFSENISYKY